MNKEGAITQMDSWPVLSYSFNLSNEHNPFPKEENKVRMGTYIY